MSDGEVVDDGEVVEDGEIDDGEVATMESGHIPSLIQTSPF